MKKLIALATVSGSLFLTGCQTPYSPGLIYSDMAAPVDVRDNAVACTKEGTATMKNYLGFLATGDASTAKAKQNAGIARVGTVDVHFTNILGLYGETTTTVCGD
ncbi:MAG: TRL-like family protein [Alcanivorax jadensis]|uniref:TRL-like family protein n=1 Tax=Alcanivorax jadensis TaxID=64988 RepID=UPI00300360D0